MSESVVVAESMAESEVVPRRGVIRRLLGRPLTVASLVIILATLLTAIFADVLAPYPIQAANLSLTNSPVGGEYLLGGDRSGRDILTQLIYSTRAAMEAVLIATSVAIVIGVVGGLIAGYYGKLADSIGSWISNIIIAVPAVILLVALYAAIGASQRVAMVALGILLAPNFFRLVRALTMSVKREFYVDAARVSGLGDFRIISRHVLYAVRGPIIIQATFAAGVAVSLQSGLEFLGLGDPTTPNWGRMLQEAFTNVFVAPLQLLWPGAALALLVSALIVLGNELRDTLEGTVRVSRRVDLESRLEPTISVVDGSRDEPALSLTGLSVAYGAGREAKQVVHDVSLTLGRGEIVGLVGESGSGKSQTAFAILDLLPAEARVTGGEIRLNLTRKPRRSGRRSLLGSNIAYVAQEPMSNLDPSFTIGHQMVTGIRAAIGGSKREARAVALGLLERVGIADPQRTLRSYPHEISGGMAQRVLIAGAVAAKPEILIADEPTTALDVTVQAEILELLRDLQQEMGMSVLLVTHNFGVVADLCDRVVVMQKGALVEDGPTQAVFDAPQSPYTAKLLGAILDVDKIRAPRESEKIR